MSQNASDHEFDLSMMCRAARLGLRGVGCVEPNPPVGCVIVDPRSRKITSEGWHTHFGGPHAEAHALSRCGHQANGATAYVTFEPCDHEGKTGPCSTALINAGIKRVVIARQDPNPQAKGGINRLREAGICVDTIKCDTATRLTDAFVKRVTTGIPWIIVKWAQTLDGRIATRSGHSQWISNAKSRAAVHRLRARVDAILTGIGTVEADDPMLTARDLRRIRKRARRVVIDPRMRISTRSRLVQTAGQFPTTVVCAEESGTSHQSMTSNLMAFGVDVLPLPARSTVNAGERIDLALNDVFRAVCRRYELTTVLVEAGPGLVSRLIADSGLVDEVLVYLAPKLVGDDSALPIWSGRFIDSMDHALPLQLQRVRQLDDDVELLYRRNESR